MLYIRGNPYTTAKQVTTVVAAGQFSIGNKTMPSNAHD
jgi:hypothetical protein